MTSISPAQNFAQQHQWLLDGDHSPITAVQATGSDSVAIVVRDAWTVGDEPDYHADMNRQVADHGASLLENTVDGVRLVVRNPDGYVGREGIFPSSDEQYFASSLPGVQSQAAQVRYDRNGDGTIGEDEKAFLFEVDSAERAQALDRILVDQYGDDYPVDFQVNPR